MVIFTIFKTKFSISKSRDSIPAFRINNIIETSLLRLKDDPYYAGVELSKKSNIFTLSSPDKGTLINAYKHIENLIKENNCEIKPR